MKHQVLFFFTLLSSLNVNAHNIKGTLVLKGSLKTEISVEDKKVTCRVRINDVKNLLEEDTYGNPAYQVRVIVSLEGLKYRRELWLNNLFKAGENQSIVKDFEYHSTDESVSMLIDENGRIKNVSIRNGMRKVNCNF